MSRRLSTCVPALSCAVTSDLSVANADSISARSPASPAFTNADAAIVFLASPSPAGADDVAAEDDLAAVAASGRGGADSTHLAVV